MPLKVAIVGAGIAGLSAATALNRAGHSVEIFERSSFSNEVGAAIHVAPNAVRILQAWEANFKGLHAVKCERLSIWDRDANHLFTPIVTDDARTKLAVTEDWLLSHRVDLHTTLRRLAEREIDGRKVKIHLSAEVKSVDASTGEIVFKDGSTHKADLIVGADGVHSKVLSAVTGAASEPVQPTGQNCWRFLVPMSKIKPGSPAHTLVTKTINALGSCNALDDASSDKRVVLYPCRDGTLLNFAAFCPTIKQDNDVEETASSWLSTGNIDQLVQTFSGFGEGVQELCRLADDVKLWSLATRMPPRAFSKGKVVLVGDAAHPMLPHQGQGGAQAIEDAAALEVLFSKDTTLEQIPARLDMYHRARYEHAVTVMLVSSVPNEQREKVATLLNDFVPGAVVPKNMFEYTWLSRPQRDAAVLMGRALGRVC